MSKEMPSRMEVVSEVVFLGKLVERAMAGKIRVPKFQRDFVWKQSDLHKLLESVLYGYPIGSILVWDTERKIETRKSIGPVDVGLPPDGLEVGYVLDGQQRLSTLVGTLRLSKDADKSIAHQVDWGVFCDLDKDEFIREPADGVKPQHFPVKNLLTTAEFVNQCRQILSEVNDKNQALKWLNKADRLANAFRDYQLPLIHIREADLKTAVIIFSRLNRAGRKMTIVEMVSALTYKEGQFDLAKKLDEFKMKLAVKSFGNIDRGILLRTVLAALEKDIYAKDWADLMVKDEVREKLPKAFELAEKGIMGALDFLKDQGVKSDRLLPYGLQLVLLGEFFRLCHEPTDKVHKLLRRWFWVTSFTGWFGRVSTTQVTRALSEVRELAKGQGSEFSIVDLDRPAQPFPERFDGRSARVRAFLLYLASLKPCSLPNGSALDPAQELATRGTKAVGYVFSNPGTLSELFSSPANRIFLAPEKTGQAFEDLVPLTDEKLKELLPRHGFPISSVQQLRKDDRLGLIEARLKYLIDGEWEFMNERKVNIPENRTEANIADSEVSDADVEMSDFD